MSKLIPLTAATATLFVVLPFCRANERDAVVPIEFEKPELRLVSKIVIGPTKKQYEFAFLSFDVYLPNGDSQRLTLTRSQKEAIVTSMSDGTEVEHHFSLPASIKKPAAPATVIYRQEWTELGESFRSITANLFAPKSNSANRLAVPNPSIATKN